MDSSQPPSYQQHQSKYNPVPTMVDDAIRDDKSESDHNHKQAGASDKETRIQFDEEMTNVQLALIQNANGDKDASDINEAGSIKTDGAQTTAKLSRVNTLHRVTTFHQDTLQRTSTGFSRISHGCDVGWFEILLLICVIFTLSCFATAIYGIYSGNLLGTKWEQYTREDIDIWCDGTYIDQFTYKSKRSRRRKDFGHRFAGMVVTGSIEIVVFVLIICYCCVYKPLFENRDESERWSDAFTAWAAYTWGFSLAWMIGWFVNFIKCLQYYKRVRRYCEEGTMIYEDTMDIFAWFYPLVIYEIVKGSVMCCILLTAWCYILIDK